jgi:GT2 family glycosyltransferase
MHGPNRVTISVLVPAFRAGRFLAQTLRSAIAQTHGDIRIHVHIDPADADGSGAPEDSVQAVEPFRSDPRLRVRCNPQRLGWDANIRGLLQVVDTPYYAILPHDDLWEPDYLQTLLAELASSPEASVAYCDLLTFDDVEPWRKGVRLPRGASLRAQLLAFLLEGAEAMPWRGVTRSDLLQRIGGFPVDGHRGFAVECEYALSLLLAGTAIHVPRTMYHKRLFPRGASSASRQRIVEAAPGELCRAWVRHASRMEELLRDGLRRKHAASDSSDVLLLAALTAAMLRRRQQFVAARLEAEQQRAALECLLALDTSTEAGADAVRSRLQLVMSRHAEAIGDGEQGDTLARLAVSSDPGHEEARLRLANRLHARGLFAEALDCASPVERSAPGMVGLGPLLRQIRSQLRS